MAIDEYRIKQQLISLFSSFMLKSLRTESISKQLIQLYIHKLQYHLIGNIILGQKQTTAKKCLFFLKRSAIMNLVKTCTCVGPLVGTTHVYV